MTESKSVEDIVLETLDKNGVIEDSGQFAHAHHWQHNETFIGSLKKLESLSYIKSEVIEHRVVTITPEGEDVLVNGSYECRVINAIHADGTNKTDLNSLGEQIANLGFAEAMKMKWVKFDKASGKVHRLQEKVEDTVKAELQALKEDPKSLSEQQLSNLKRRRFAKDGVQKVFKLTKGEKFAPRFVKAVADITVEMLTSGSWATTQFKDLNLHAQGLPPTSGHLHPLMKVRHEIRCIFLEMGFEEMPTNNYVENSFWNFDSLFQPQQHPARDAHDTFFLSDPAISKEFPQDYLERVKEMHSKGGLGSIGWRYDWKIEEAQKNILRTHTTAVSSRMLYKLANQPGGFKPAKYFSIDRVFRNETLDATHLAEFHQIEGLVADYNLTLSNLIGVIYQFFKRMGISDVRFKPAYNPYTEPSMEIFGYHPMLKRWVEIGNSGMFRPEMLLPMGLPENVNVIAWGLSLERPTMIKYGIDHIRDIFGPKMDLGLIKSNPICFMDH